MSQEDSLLPPRADLLANSMDITTLLPVLVGPSHSPTATLKRRASATLEDAEPSSSRKRMKEDTGAANEGQPDSGELVNGHLLAEELEQELQCGCCAGLVYRPVLVAPCQHFFCGSCIVLWIKNGGANCPACRGISTSVTPSRVLQLMADILVRHAPSKARSANERMQADEIYKAGTNLRIPIPRAPSPEPSIPQLNANYVQPCPHCAPDNQWGWRCPQPITDPEVDPDNAWHQDDSTPPGHGYCGNCENILALNAPTTSKCDFCQVSFCGISVPSRCVAAPLANQHLHMLSDIGDMIQCGDIYDVFDGNAVEVDILLDYMTANNLTPRHIYREVLGMILSSPQGFQPLIDEEIFMDVHRVAGGPEPEAGAIRNRICRICATEVLLWGLRQWWMLERKKGRLDESVTSRLDCSEGRACPRQKDHVHAKEFNHIILPRELPQLNAGSALQNHPQPQAGPSQVPDVPRELSAVTHTDIYQPEAGPSSAIRNQMPNAIETDLLEDDLMNDDSMDFDFDLPQGNGFPAVSRDLIAGHPEVVSGMKDIALDGPDKEYHLPGHAGGIPVPSSQEIVDAML
ncbi:hypothetical protein NM688_g8623 [Phlebia brevispora]|uniref:Uncharacterized protein n=1 Tax=Phlebia brevispora TaxID=194682 RepID=A0ACC1RQ94_9APHY|nr:hypothetical protein NM688_g8623 [Phlebia brevispora]